GQCVFERGFAVVHRPGRVRDGDGFGSQDGAAAALAADVAEVGGEAVADVDHRVQFDGGVELQCLADPRGEVEVMAADGTAERAGDEEPVAGAGAASPDRAAAG